MKIIKEEHRFIIQEDEKVLLETGYLNGEFVLGIHGNEEIKITKDLDKALYENLMELLDNTYFFSDGISCQTENQITYLSNDKIDWLNGGIENLNRLILRREKDCIYIKAFNSYFDKYGIETDGYIISLTTNKNSLYNANAETGIPFQIDLENALKNTRMDVYKLKLKEIPLGKKR